MLFLINLNFKVQIYTTIEIRLNMPTDESFAFLNVKAGESQSVSRKQHKTVVS